MRPHLTAMQIVALATCLALPTGAHAQLPGSALSLSGNDQYACTEAPIGQPAQLTISARVRIPPGASSGAIVSNHNHGANWESVELRADAFIINSSNASATRSQVSLTGIDDDQWHHIAGVWDGVEIRTYVDGVPHTGPFPRPHHCGRCATLRASNKTRDTLRRIA